MVRHQEIDLFEATKGFYFGEILLLNTTSLVDIV